MWTQVDSNHHSLICVRGIYSPLSSASAQYVHKTLSSISSRNHLEDGAQGGTRTLTSFRTLAPEASASTNSATWAGEPGYVCCRGYGIRTHERLKAFAGFQDRCLQPLDQPSAAHMQAIRTSRGRHKWQRWKDSNPRMAESKSAALTSLATPLQTSKEPQYLAGAEGLEPPRV